MEEAPINPAYVKDHRWRNKDRAHYNALQRKSYRKCRPERLERMKKWKKDNIDYERNRKLISQYGVSLAEKYEMIERQNGLCVVCGLPFVVSERDRKGKSPCIDHDHATGKHREIIHRSCNSALGLLSDDPSILRKAADYIERHRAP